MKGITIKHYGSIVYKISSFLAEQYALGLRFDRVWTCAELENLQMHKLFSNLDHVLQTTSAARKKKNVICIKKTSNKQPTNMATKANLSHKNNQIIDVHRKENRRANSTLSYSIPDGESVRVAGVPLDITLLVSIEIGIYQDLKQLLPVNHIKGLAEVHGAPIPV
jgi:hypothetical protein